MLREHEIVALAEEIRPDQVQPASLDLRLGPTAYRVRASFLPGRQATVMERIEQLDGYAIDLRAGAVLEKGCVYVVPLMERLALSSASGLTGFANPKSSTGRLDILTRLMTDRGEAFDHVERGYQGPLYHRDRAAHLQHRRAHGHAAQPGALPPRLAGDRRHRDPAPAGRGRARPGRGSRGAISARSWSASPSTSRARGRTRSSAIAPRSTPTASTSTASAPTSRSTSGSRSISAAARRSCSTPTSSTSW